MENPFDSAGMAAGYATSRPPVAFSSALLPGAATFLLSLPLVVIVGLAWAGLLKLSGLPIEPQDAVALFAQTKSPLLLALLIALATLVAPITEELIFRAGLFRYVRTRLPRSVGVFGEVGAAQFQSIFYKRPSSCFSFSFIVDETIPEH